MEYEEHEQFLVRVAEPSNKGTQFVLQDGLIEIENNYTNKATTSLAILEENYIWTQGGMGSTSYSPIFETYNDISGWMDGSNGIIDFWRRKYSFYEASKQSSIGPQVLTMDHLMIGFLVCRGSFRAGNKRKEPLLVCLIPAIVSICIFI